MSEFVEEIRKLFLVEKGLILEEVGYMEPPKERERYNTSLVIGNINLIAGRFKTKKEGDELVERFMNAPLP